MNIFFRIFQILFTLFLAVFLLGGLAIVIIQLVGVVSLSESVVTWASSALAPWTFAAATLCAVCAFVLRYRGKQEEVNVD